MSGGILVVEQYADLRLAIRSALSGGAYACDTVATPEEAIARLEHHRYDAILLAPRLPIASDTVVQFLIVNQPEEMSKVILMTDPEAGTGPFRCLAKPFNREELMREMPHGRMKAEG